MKKNILKLALGAILTVMPLVGQQASAQVPANCSDVMLQAFDYYPKPISLPGFPQLTVNDSKWTTLNSQVVEIGQSFQMIWLPPSGYAGAPVGSTNMGYLPKYWFTQNSSFGVQADLKTPIANLKTNNCKAIADIVVNHRDGITDWCNFATESYNGVTYTPNSSWICTDDESRANAPAGCNNPQGAADTGEKYEAARDLDHSNSQVRDAIKGYLSFMKNEMGYSGWRYDVAAGFGPQYVGEYDDAAAGYFSVGEVMKCDYTAVETWINGTGKKSTAFDFPFQCSVRDAFNGGDLTKLVWKFLNTTNQPAGLIHNPDLRRYATTFIENHDTYRYGLAYTGNIPAGNAFMLGSPGVPTVYLPHWIAYKSDIKKMIAARKKAGLHSQSAVVVLQTAGNIYVGEATGTNGKLIVKVGSGSYSAPAGYTLECSGTDWAMWTKTSDPAAPIISADKASGLYVGGTTVTLSSTGGVSPVKIYYTINGSAPSAASTLYSTPISINSNNTRLRAVAIDKDGIVSSNSIDNTYLTEQPAGVTVKFKAPAAWTTVACYVWTTATPAVNLAGAWPGTVVTKGADGYYSYTITNATSYPVNVIFNNNANEQTVDLSASANICWDYGTSSVVSGKTIYTVTESASCGSTAPVVSISPAGGYYANGTNVTLSSTGGVAPVKIYYTTNGSTPTASSTLYSAPFPVTNATVMAIAIDNNNVKSDVKSETYTNVAPTGIKVTFTAPSSWTKVSCYVWTGTDTKLAGAWPGTDVTASKVGDTYSYTITNISVKPLNVIFNNSDILISGNKEQTVDLSTSANICWTYGTSTVANAVKKYNATVVACTTSLDDHSAKASISIYPNPARETLTVESDNNITEVKIYSIYGTLVKSVYLNSNSQTIELSGLPAGYYSVVVVSENGKQTNTKLIKR